MFRTILAPEANVVSRGDLRQWHERLGHVNVKYLREMIEKDLIKGVKITDMKDFFCEGCQYGKQHKLPFSSNKQKKTVPGERIYYDLCGPMETPSIGGAKYYILFKDNASAFCTIMFIKHKSDSLECFQKYVNVTKNKFGRSIKVFHTDNGTEFCNFEFQNYLSKQGISMKRQRHILPRKTPEWNERIERS